MSTLIMMRGVPGSGKTTRALELISQNKGMVRVNRDDIRLELWGLRKGAPANEYEKYRSREKSEIIPERNRRITEALLAGKSVVVDDTNLTENHEKQLRALAESCDAQFQIRRLDTPLDKCIRRNAARPDGERVPEDVIRQMQKQLDAASQPTFAPYVGQAGLPEVAICDLDGTAALFTKADRNPYDCSRADEIDKPNYAVRSALTGLYSTGNVDEVIYLSGRSDKFRPQTERFLRKHGFPRTHDLKLYMRKEGDFRKDWIVKGELFDAHVRGKYNVLLMLDDRNQVVDFWRSLGLTCFQVAPGAF
jgi:predicted kinase